MVEIPKGTTGLGLSIVGGADTLLVRNIRVCNKTIMMMTTTTAMLVMILMMTTMNCDDCSDDYDEDVNNDDDDECDYDSK